MNARTVFRILLAAYAALAIGYIVKVMFIGPGVLPDAALAYLTWWNEQPQSDLELALARIGSGAMVLSIVAALAMAFFLRWARPAFVISILAMVVGEFFLDFPVLLTPTESFANSVLGMCAGGIVVFSYYSEISNAFEKKAT